MKRWSRQIIIGVSVALGLAGVATSASSDPSLVSPSYRIDESMVGGTGDYNSASGNYSFAPSTDDGGSTLGDNFAGNSASSNYQVNGGFNTTAQPGLTMVVNTSSVNLGVLSSSTASTATATFDVTNYTSYGYVVQVVGTPPTNNGHTLSALTTDTASAAGSEQFGINLVKNTSPSSLGDDPLQVADNVYTGSSFAYGLAGTGAATPYAKANQYRFNSGETIASSIKSSGDTRYTISFLANISGITPGGAYASNIDLVATGTY